MYMGKPFPPLNGLRFFDAAARHLSFTQAAEELSVTQAAVSHQIKALEQFLGIKLFYRRNRSLFLTESGLCYYQDLRGIFADLQQATKKLQNLNTHGPLKVSLPSSFAIHWLIPRLASFKQHYPNIDIHIEAVDTQEEQLADEVDMAIFYGRGHWPELRVEKLYSEYLIPVCAPSLLDGKLPPQSVADLLNFTLLHDASQDDWASYLQQSDSGQEPILQGSVFSHSSMALQAAIYGQGIALANNVMVQNELENGRLICPFNQVLVSQNAFYLVFKAHHSASGRVCAFRQWILDKSRSEQEQFRFCRD